MIEVFAEYAGYAYLFAAVCFILSIRGLSSPSTAQKGNWAGIIGMLVVVLTTLAQPQVLSYTWIIAGIALGGTIGTVFALKVRMTALPQMVALFNSFVGLAAVFIAASALGAPENFDIAMKDGNWPTIQLFEMGLSVLIGAVTFTGSIVAFGKLQGIFRSSPIVFPFQHGLNAILLMIAGALLVIFCINSSPVVFTSLVILTLVIGVLIIIPIGGADMPVVISVLNSYSGWASCSIGFTVGNTALIVNGAIVGASGAILSYIMCKNMNRSIMNVLLGGFGADGGAVAQSSGTAEEERPVKSASADDAAYFMQNAESIIVVPGYGLAVAQAQHAIKEMAETLKKQGIQVRFAIHPVAGRMPGHMNVLLAEANVPYEDVLELEQINRDFAMTDVVLVVGANDVTNPSAKTDPSSPIFGMPILDVGMAKQVFFVKRSMAAGYAGVQNELFFQDNTFMIFGDAKLVVENIVKAI